MIQKQSQQSLLELLLRIMPDLKDHMGPGRGKANSKAANTLYTIWSNEAAKVAGNRFRRPDSVASADMRLLETEGLVKCSGEELTITTQGGEVLKQMILGDTASAFDDDKPVDYLTALANLSPVRRKRTKVASSEPRRQGHNWYTEMKNGI